MNPLVHRLPSSFLQEQINVHVVGAGGNGAQFVNGMGRLNMSLKALGHPHGFHVRLFDPEVVSDANVGRQLFSSSDVGQPKSFVVINRLNAFYGTNWSANHSSWALKGESIGNELNEGEKRKGVHFVVGCVDSAASRRSIASIAEAGQTRYWLDLGNEAKTGQCILGETRAAWKHKDLDGNFTEHWERGGKSTARQPRLPTVMDLYPELHRRVKEDDAPSCSLAGALQRQDLFINQTVATFALNLLWRFFRKGELDIHGCFVNLQSGSVNSLAVDPDGWQRFGYHCARIAPLRRIKKVLRPIRPFNAGLFLLECGHRQEGHGKLKIRCERCMEPGQK